MIEQNTHDIKRGSLPFCFAYKLLDVGLLWLFQVVKMLYNIGIRVLVEFQHNALGALFLVLLIVFFFVHAFTQ